MYEVIVYFTDNQDNGHPYNVGDAYPRKGLEVSEERIAELSTADNKRHRPLICATSHKETPKQDQKTDPETPEEPVAPAQPEDKPKKEVKNGRSNNTKSAKSGSGKKK